MTVSPGSKNLALGVAAGIASAAGFSLKAVLAKLVYRHGVDATTLLALRMAFAFPFYAVLAWFAARRETAKPIGAPLAMRIAFVGIMGYFVASYFDFLGLQHISAGLERLVLYLYPTLVMAIGFVAFKRRVSGREVAALVVAYAGLAVALSGSAGPTRASSAIATGVGLVFASAFTYAIYVAYSGELVHRVGSLRFTSVAMLAATVPMLTLFVARGGVARLGSVPAPAYGLAVVMAIFATVLPSLLMTEGIKRLGSNRASIVGSVGPVATIGLEAALLGEPVTARGLVGTVLVVCGVLGASLSGAGASTRDVPVASTNEPDPLIGPPE